MEQEVYFYSDGYKLWARMLIPDDLKPGEKRAAVVECPGFRHGAVDPKSLGRKGSAKITQLLLQAGYIIMIPHCRCVGKSQGRPGYTDFPRTRLNPFHEIEDLRNALTYLEQRPEVDPERLGTYGYSYGGALSPYLAAEDNRVKACVGALGVGDGEVWMRRLRRDWEFQAFKKRVNADLKQQVLTGKPEFVEPLEIMIPDPASVELGAAHYGGLLAELRFTLDSAHYIMNFKTVDVADKINCPLLIIGAGADSLCPVDDYVRVYYKAREPKKLIVIPGLTHYQTYLPENVDKLAVPLTEWFQQWLPAKST